MFDLHAYFVYLRLHKNSLVEKIHGWSSIRKPWARQPWAAWLMAHSQQSTLSETLLRIAPLLHGTCDPAGASIPRKGKCKLN